MLLTHKPKFKRVELDEECWVDVYQPLPISIKDSEFEELWSEHPVHFDKIRTPGGYVPIPRWQQSYGLDYTFSGSKHKAKSTPDIIGKYLEYVNTLGYGSFNQIFVNWYENGLHYIGPHPDSEKQLIPGSPIVSISLGAERKFRIRKIDNSTKKTNQIVKDLMMPHGTILIMGGLMQSRYTHEVPKINGKKGINTGRRINITFRQFRK